MLQFSQFVWPLSYSVWDVFNNFLLIDATDKSKISRDQKRFFIALSLYPLSFFVNTPFNSFYFFPSQFHPFIPSLIPFISILLNSFYSYLPQFLLYHTLPISSIPTFLNSFYVYLPQFLPFLPSSISSIPTLLNFFYFLPSSIPAIPTLLKSFYFYLPQFHLYLPSPFLLFLPSSIPSIPTFLNSFYTYPRHFFYSYSPHFFHSYPPWFLLFLPSSLQFQSYTPTHPHSPCVFYYVYVGVTPRHLNTLICLFIFKPGTTTLYSYPIFLPFSYRVTYCALYI